MVRRSILVTLAVAVGGGVDRHRAGGDGAHRRLQLTSAQYVSPAVLRMDAGGRPAQRLADRLPGPGRVHEPADGGRAVATYPDNTTAQHFARAGRRHVLLLRRRERRLLGGTASSRGAHGHDRHDAARPRPSRSRARPRRASCRAPSRSPERAPTPSPASPRASCASARSEPARRAPSCRRVEHHALHGRFLRRLQHRHRQGRLQRDRGADGHGRQRRPARRRRSRRPRARHPLTSRRSPAPIGVTPRRAPYRTRTRHGRPRSWPSSSRVRRRARMR